MLARHSPAIAASDSCLWAADLVQLKLRILIDFTNENEQSTAWKALEVDIIDDFATLLGVPHHRYEGVWACWRRLGSQVVAAALKLLRSPPTRRECSLSSPFTLWPKS